MDTLKKWLRQNKFALFFLTFLVFAVYLNSLGNDFVSDDIPSISNNPNIGKIDYVLYFKSLRALIIYLTHKVFALDPLFYRLSNIFLHLGSTIVIYSLVAFFFAPPVPLLTASIFAVHPLLTESVTWISGAPYSNGAFFALLSFLSYIHAVKTGSRKSYSLSLCSFLLGLACLDKIIVFPAILTLYELCFGQVKRGWKRLVPYWGLNIFWLLYLFGLLGKRMAALETTFYQAPGFHNPLLQVPIAITSYLELIFWPKNLTLYHSEMSFTQTEYILRLVGFIFFLATIAWFYKKDKRLFFWLSFFLISLLPTLTPFGISWIVAERYVYLGSIGIFVFIAWSINKIGEITSRENLAKGKPFGLGSLSPKGWGIGEVEQRTNQISFIILSILLIVLSFRTILRNRDWKNQDSLWLATAKTSPSSPQNHNNSGDYYGRHGNLEKAVEEFKRAIELNPRYGDAYHNLANTYQQMGKAELAIENYQDALSFNPNLWQSYQNLAAIYFSQQKYELALQEIQNAIKTNPKNSLLYTNLGVIYLKLGNSQNAKNSLNQALKLDPENQQAKELLLSPNLAD
ncbi:tetratricopeptide repeat protein [Candidatus Shapirobacteria bacterium]|nr:tetratricopeptide repeat protein [Candidatus Shapirobacteria bacterium]